jgi:DNA-directed RNA polymerase specialized sigma24 family protein
MRRILHVFHGRHTAAHGSCRTAPLRTPLVLRERGGWKHDRIAKHLGITVNAVSMRLHRARTTLRKSLGPFRG